MNKLLILFIIILQAASAQTKDPGKILLRVKENFNKINDYKADVKIKVDVEFIKVPDMEAVLFFKQPDKIHLDSEGFAMLPKSGMNFSPSSLLSGDYTSFYEREEIIDGINTSVIKIIPLGGGGDIVLSTLWIDIEKNQILRVESTTKTQGTFSIEMSYDKEMTYPLPSQMIFTFNIEKMDLPKGMGGDINTKPKEESKNKSTTGKVYINYTGYKINEGLPDELFIEPQK